MTWQGVVRRHRKRLVFAGILWVGIAVGIALATAGELAVGIAAFVVAIGFGILGARQIRTPAGS